MKAKKFTFYLGVIVFLFAACGIDNGGWWYAACIGGLMLSWLTIATCTKREQAYILNVGKKFKDYKF